MTLKTFTGNTWLTSCMLLCMLATGFATRAQMFMDVMPNARPGDPAVILYGGSNLDNSIPYSRIQGSPFWNDDYQLAGLFGENEKDKWLMKTRLNLTTGEVYFLTKTGEELVAPPNMVRKIIFYKDGDVTKPGAVFRYNYGEKMMINKIKDYYVQVMNEGNYQLLKYNQRPVGSADSFHIAKRYFFKDDIKYFLQYDNRTIILKKLSRDYVLEHLPGAGGYNEWIDQNKINLKKEEDVARFLEYYNTKK